MHNTIGTTITELLATNQTQGDINISLDGTGATISLSIRWVGEVKIRITHEGVIHLHGNEKLDTLTTNKDGISAALSQWLE